MDRTIDEHRYPRHHQGCPHQQQNRLLKPQTMSLQEELPFSFSEDPPAAARSQKAHAHGCAAYVQRAYSEDDVPPNYRTTRHHLHIPKTVCSRIHRTVSTDHDVSCSCNRASRHTKDSVVTESCKNSLYRKIIDKKFPADIIFEDDEVSCTISFGFFFQWHLYPPQKYSSFSVMTEQINSEKNRKPGEMFFVR